MTDLPARLFAARDTLGRNARLGRPLTPLEMAGALGFEGDRSEEDLLKMERGVKKITGPVTRLIEAYEAGYVPASRLPRAKGSHSRLRVDVSDAEIIATVARHGEARGARARAARELGISPAVVTRRLGAKRKTPASG